MTDEKYSIYLSFFSVFVFLVSAVICYIKINKNIDEVDTKSSLIVFTFENNESFMNINTADMLTAQDKEIASTTATLSALYTNLLDNEYKFKIIMENYSPYTKTEGVDGINAKEYTYEVLKDNKVILTETEIPSYEKDSEIILLEDTLTSQEQEVIYNIVFRFYTNKYDQNHLVGTQLNSNIKMEAIN